tara:strand:+ start:2871 stop:4022 length:1152 start_codon:yes stop_codon:yes gene_type:complete
MLNTKEFGKELGLLGFNFYSGVPCSFLKGLINYAQNNFHYICAANEGDAVAIASGAHIAGKKSVVLMQNSGLTNAVSPLTSLNYTFKIPLLGFTTLRGEENINDEPQHELMGKITTKLLDLLQIKWQFLSKNQNEAINQLKIANEYILQNKPFFFVVKKGTFGMEILKKKEVLFTKNSIKFKKSKSDSFPDRLSVLKSINAIKNNQSLLLATTGKTGRELFTIEDSKNKLYMVGSMGCISSLGLGISLNQREKKVIVIDGDGSVLMRMGSLAICGYNNPDNMLHILLDNNAHDSTGGQKTVSQNIDFISIAASCGYKIVKYVHCIKELENAIIEWYKNQGLTFLHIKTALGSVSNLGRPNIKPHKVKERLIKFISDSTEPDDN